MSMAKAAAAAVSLMLAKLPALPRRAQGEASSPAGFAAGLCDTSTWTCPGLRENSLLIDLSALTVRPAYI